jgi:hypothetical protein
MYDVLKEYFFSHPQASIVLTVCVTVFFIVVLFISASRLGWLSNLHIGKEGLNISGGNNQKELKEIKTLLEDDRKDWIERMEGFDKEINSIKTDVQNISRILLDHEEFQEKISEGTLENMLFNDNVSTFKRLKAYKRLIALGKNGKIKAKGFNLILNNKETWEAVQETDLNLKIVDQKYFDSVMEHIDKQIFRY